MRAPAQYMALHDIQVPGSYAFAARTGDDVTEMQRVNLKLVVGVDVRPLTPEAMPRPADDADRGEWQNYAVVRGVPYEEAVNLDRGELLERIELAEDESEQQAVASGMPETDALKAAWVEWAETEILRSTAGQVSPQEAHDRAAGATKAKLIEAFGPEATAEARAPFLELPEPPATSGDPVAEQARADRQE